MVWSVADQAAVYTVAPCTSVSLKRVGAMQQGERRESKRTSTGKKPSRHKKQSKRAYSVIVGMQDPHQQK